MDEGDSTCVMLVACWKAIGSPMLISSPTMLKAFNGNTFRTYGNFPSFSVELGGMTVSIEVEVIDAPLEYNLLLDQSWTYVMKAMVSSIHRVIKLPHKGKIVTIDQLSFCCKNPTQREPNLPMVNNSTKAQQNASVGLYPSLMGTFSFPALKMCMISHVTNDPPIREVSFKTYYLFDP